MELSKDCLIQYIQSQRKLEAVPSLALGCDHIGAILSESILLPGVRYRSVVRPLIQRLLKEYPEGKKSGNFVHLVEEISPKYFFNWDENDKPRRVLAVAKYLHELGVETVDEFRWLFEEPDFPKALKEIRGIGNRHIDEFKLLLKLPCESVSGAILTFLQEAGLSIDSLQAAEPLLTDIAQELNLERDHFDLCICRYAMNDK